MARILPLGAEVTLTAGASNASTFGSATVVRILNDSGSAVLITRRDSNAQVLGSFTIADGGSELVEKNPTDDLFGTGGNVKVAKVGYTG